MRQLRPCIFDAADIAVLSRVTLGADVAVTSVIIDGLKRRFPQARIWFVGPRKNYELFAADARVSHIPLEYPRRGSISERIAVAQALVLPDEALVIDPDSRITQLGLVPVSKERNYFLFESRSFDEQSPDPLPVLAARWCEQVFGAKDARAYIAPASTVPGADTAISLGVGGNAAKRLDAAFERQLVTAAAARGSVLIDRGASDEEMERVDRAADGLPVTRFTGSFADFAGAISRSRAYFGYDSAGQHVAAACGVPLTIYFTGAVSQRFRQRWRPHGPGEIQVISETPLKRDGEE
ncbi:MAG: hypothetical protein NTZ56_09325 [Acidobacteria bacterium]|nr:hypothetical protein [Acidobacteriota bacterium]